MLNHLLDCMFKYVFWWWACMFGLVPSQRRKGLSKRPRLTTLAQNCVKYLQEISRSMILNMDCKGGREVSLVACDAMNFGQTTAPISTSHFTSSGLDSGSWTWSWKFLRNVEAWNVQIGYFHKDHEPSTWPWSSSQANKLGVVPRRAAQFGNFKYSYFSFYWVGLVLKGLYHSYI